MTETPQDTSDGINDASPDYKRHSNGFAWRALRETEALARATDSSTGEQSLEQWNCPICSVPQTADEIKFNQHIDGCLSRQTIQEMVQEHSPVLPRSSAQLNEDCATKRKRGKLDQQSVSLNGPGNMLDGRKRPRAAFFS